MSDTRFEPGLAAPERKVWVISTPCGWSRMVPRSTPAARRRQLVHEHCAEHGCRDPEPVDAA